MRIGNYEFDTMHHTAVMGILNVTPDSFSDGGKYNSLDQALYHTQQMIEEGAAIVDVGGESARPGHIRITEEEEIDRVVPVIEAIRKRFDIPISLDTYKAKVAEAGIAAGADLLNDIWGLQEDDALGKVVAESGVAYCLMHNRKNPKPGLTGERLKEELMQDASRAMAAGISRDRIILDPGVGFAKTQEENLMAIAHFGECQSLGFPLLLGTSRKSCINYVLDLPVEERVEGTLATTAYAVMQHIGFVRVHDVKENVRFIKMMEAIRERE